VQVMGAQTSSVGRVACAWVTWAILRYLGELAG
jgi:hypothetical protein